MKAPPFSLIQSGRFGKSATLYNGNLSVPCGRLPGWASTLLGMRTVRMNEIRKLPFPIHSSLHLILAPNNFRLHLFHHVHSPTRRSLGTISASSTFGLNLAKYLTNGVSMFISTSVEGPDVTLRLFGMWEAVVVDIVAV